MGDVKHVRLYPHASHHTCIHLLSHSTLENGDRPTQKKIVDPLVSHRWRFIYNRRTRLLFSISLGLQLCKAGMGYEIEYLIIWHDG